MKRQEAVELLRSSAGFNDNELVRRVLLALEPARGSGWISFTDTQYTSANPLICPANTDTPLTLTYTSPDANGAYAGDMGPSVVQGSTFMGFAEGDSYLIRLGITMRIATDMSAPIRGIIASLLSGLLVANVTDRQNDVTLGIKFGSAFTTTDTRTTPREQDAAKDFTALFLVNVRGENSPIVDPGGTLFVRPTENTEVYDIDIAVQRFFAVEA